MERVCVSSSHIDSIGYNEDNLTLEVKFLDWSIYQYFPVPSSQHFSIMNASSHGKYLIDNIIPNYKSRRL